MWSNHLRKTYRIDNYTIVPNSNTLESVRSLNSFILISFSNPRFYGRKLEKVVEFAYNNSNKVLILTTGYLYRHSYVTINPLCPDHSLKLAKLFERRYVQSEIDRILPSYPCDLEVKYWEELSQSSAYQNELLVMHQLYDRLPKFKAQVDHFTEAYILNSPIIRKQLVSQAIKDAILQVNRRKGVLFILEEIAMIAHLTKNGYPVWIYAGLVFPIFEQLISGEFDTDYDGFKHSIQIALELTRHSKRVSFSARQRALNN